MRAPVQAGYPPLEAKSELKTDRLLIGRSTSTGGARCAPPFFAC
jgi:hypothetical protein